MVFKTYILKRNVLVLTTEGVFSPIFQNQALPLLGSVVKDGFRLYIISLEKGHKLYKFDLIKKVIHIYCVPLFILPLSLTLPVSLLFLSAVSFLLVIYKRCNILHIRRYNPIIPALFIKKILRKKVIFDPRGLWPEESLSAGRWGDNSLKYRLAKWIEQIGVLNSDRIIVVSPPFLDYIKRISGSDKKITIIPNGVDLEHFRVGTKSKTDKLVLVYAGGMSHWHLVDEMAEFFKDILVERPAYFLFLTYEKNKIAKDILKGHGLRSDDFSVQAVAPTELPQYLASCDAAISFKKPSLGVRVCSPIKLGEYLASGLPVVINPGMGEMDAIVRKERVGILVDPHSEEDRKEKALELLHLTDAQDIKSRCRIVATKFFSMEKNREILSNLYAEI